MAGLWTGAAQGLDRGLDRGLRMAETARDNQRQDRADAENAEQRKFQNDMTLRQTEATEGARKDAKQWKQSELQIKDLDDQIGNLRTRLRESAALNPTAAADPGILNQITQLQDQRRTTLGKLGGYEYRQNLSKYGQMREQLEAGKLDFEAMSPEDTANFLMYQERQPLSFYLRGEDGSPSPAEQAVGATHQSMEKGDVQGAAKSASVFAQPDAEEAGVGTRTPDGSIIVSKGNVEMHPHPQDPEQMVFGVRVEVERPDGKRGSYFAPVTQKRSSDPNDPVKLSRTDEVLDWFGKKATITQLFSTPGMQTKLREAQKLGADKKFIDNRAAYVQAGGSIADLDRGKLEARKAEAGIKKDEASARASDALAWSRRNPTASGGGGGLKGDAAQIEYLKSNLFAGEKDNAKRTQMAIKEYGRIKKLAQKSSGPAEFKAKFLAAAADNMRNDAQAKKYTDLADRLSQNIFTGEAAEEEPETSVQSNEDYSSLWGGE